MIASLTIHRPGCQITRSSNLLQPRKSSRIAATNADNAFLGIDFGTSGARCYVINSEKQTLATTKTAYASAEPQQLAAAWTTALFELLDALPADLRAKVASIAIDGTSATTLLLDATSGAVLQPPKLYNEAQAASIVHRVKALAPPDHTTTASTSTLCKVLTWHEAGVWQRAAADGMNPVILHHSDWLASLLHGERRATDWNNALKLGFDPEPGVESYPEWLIDQEFACLFPTAVFAPGSPVANLTPEVSQRTGIPETCIVCAGTTDSIAAFLAAGVTEPGQAVTSLGSTMAIKLLSDRRVDNAAFGVYSHRLGSGWLVGGASNTGGACLRAHFSDAQLQELTSRMDPAKPTGLQYTVLPSKGERFPVNDPELAPCLEPRPGDDAVFLQGMLEGMARTEAQAYRVLQELGATAVEEVWTAGGGAANPVWTELRARALGVPVKAAEHGEAAYGAALLALQGYSLHSSESWMM